MVDNAAGQVTQLLNAVEHGEGVSDQLFPLVGLQGNAGVDFGLIGSECHRVGFDVWKGRKQLICRRAGKNHRRQPGRNRSPIHLHFVIIIDFRSL